MAMVGGVSPSSKTKGEYEFLIETDGTYFYAYDAEGNLVYGGPVNAGGITGTDAAAVINAAEGALGGSIQERIVIKGDI